MRGSGVGIPPAAPPYYQVPKLFPPIAPLPGATTSTLQGQPVARCRSHKMGKDDQVIVAVIFLHPPSRHRRWPMSPAPLHQPDGMITQVRQGCGPFRVRVNGILIARTTIGRNSQVCAMERRRLYSVVLTAESFNFPAATMLRSRRWITPRS